MLGEETEGETSRYQVSNQPASFTGISTMSGHSFCKFILLLDRTEDTAIAYLRLALCAHIHMHHAHMHEQVRENCRHISFDLKDQGPTTWTIQLTFKSTSLGFFHCTFNCAARVSPLVQPGDITIFKPLFDA